MYDVHQTIVCTDSNIVYVVECRRCHLQYVKNTTSTFKVRMNAHRSAPAKHFESPGNRLSDSSTFAMEIVVGGEGYVIRH